MSVADVKNVLIGLRVFGKKELEYIVQKHFSQQKIKGMSAVSVSRFIRSIFANMDEDKKIKEYDRKHIPGSYAEFYQKKFRKKYKVPALIKFYDKNIDTIKRESIFMPTFGRRHQE